MEFTILCHQQPISTKSYNAAAGSLRRLQAAAAGRQILSYKDSSGAQFHKDYFEELPPKPKEYMYTLLKEGQQR